MKEDNLSVYHCFIESTRIHTCMREDTRLLELVLVLQENNARHKGNPPPYMYVSKSFNKTMIYTNVLLPHICTGPSASIKQ
jgi:hypothetical protein